MKILVINSGSSSIKYQLLDMENDSVLASGVIECIGLEQGILTHKKAPDTDAAIKIVVEQPIPDHAVGMHLAVDALTHPEHGVITDASEIDGVGHRIVHGGEKFTTPMLVDQSVIDGIREVADLAPLHNLAHLTGIEVAQSIFKCKHVTVFDTAFHQTMPAKAYQYAIPYEIYEELHVRRYGFHGTSHKYVARRTAELLGKPAEDLNIITVHLGNGSSLAAIQGGKCIDTSMGMTPLAGVIMGTRSGNVDPAVLKFIAEKKGLSIQEVEEMLTKRSGLVGICGMSDMRDIHSAIEKGDERAKLALDMVCHRVRQYIGAYWAELGRVDAIVFTAGIGENDDIVRLGVLKGMEPMGVILDEAANAKRAGEWARISTPESKVDVLVVRTNEELEIARETVKFVK
ncbi:acetate kinase [Desulfovibrio ferrophilus]|uniref:Acetate kinase n=1 Tax=Desulfovibrio ferrophilus TaxID=241368 RepID=A0A2Z6B3N6_9BACT|nr:acetate kinase [Desulfovibrio ferrophilus]BBD10020.1 acetate kinase [Desulfovibrio ferrophilus]